MRLFLWIFLRDAVISLVQPLNPLKKRSLTASSTMSFLAVSRRILTPSLPVVTNSLIRKVVSINSKNVSVQYAALANPLCSRKVESLLSYPFVPDAFHTFPTLFRLRFRVLPRLGNFFVSRSRGIPHAVRRSFVPGLCAESDF